MNDGMAQRRSGGVSTIASCGPTAASTGSRDAASRCTTRRASIDRRDRNLRQHRRAARSCSTPSRRAARGCAHWSTRRSGSASSTIPTVCWRPSASSRRRASARGRRSCASRPTARSSARTPRTATRSSRRCCQATMDRLSDDGESVEQVLKTGEPLLFHGLTAAASDTLGRRSRAARQARPRRLRVVPARAAHRRRAPPRGALDRRRAPGTARASRCRARGRPRAARRVGARAGAAVAGEPATVRGRASDRRVAADDDHPRPTAVDRRRAGRGRVPARPRSNVDVGGDWYDAFETADGRIVVVVGDVAGHGVEAASLMGRVRNALRAYAFEDSDPASILLRAASPHPQPGRRRDGDRVRRALRTRDRTHVVVARRPSAAVAGLARRHDPLPRRRERRAARHDGARVPHRDDAARPGRVARLLHRRSRRTARPRPRRRARLARRTRARIRGRGRSARLCDKLVDDPFVPHPSPDDICVLALRIQPAHDRSLALDS